MIKSKPLPVKQSSSSYDQQHFKKKNGLQLTHSHHLAVTKPILNQRQKAKNFALRTNDFVIKACILIKLNPRGLVQK